ncbi:hypothetical protein [Tissierella sp.]|uniref:hypothetical protein n=1 Tax=Tissierella sp. TaxID=41274 RepID=UPI00285B4A16|nr:hypothetical protein [Tissierella sp.]MDR7856071.1 hypothetical protein [Tissierella sp.]
MMKPCVVLNGNVINIGEWEYQYIEINGEQVSKNPIPDGAIIEDREFEYSEDHGWREVGWVPSLSEVDKLKISQAEQFEAILELLGGM